MTGTAPAMPERITTPRLRLRPYDPNDVDAVYAYATNPDWSTFLPVPSPYRRVHAEDFVSTQLTLDRVSHASWAIVAGNDVVGGINIRFLYAHQVGEIGYSIARPCWGRGFATEAVRGVVGKAFGTHRHLHRIRASADLRNVASQRVLEKTGFTREGVLRQNRVVRDVPVDEVWFGLLRSEWTP